MSLALLSKNRVAATVIPRSSFPLCVRSVSSIEPPVAVKHSRWTEPELHIILDGVLADRSNHQIVRSLPGRKYASLIRFMHNLVWSRTPSDWSQTETDIIDSCIKSNHATRQIIESLPHREAKAIVGYALQRLTRSNTVPWSAAEDETIRCSIRDGLSFRQTLHRLPGRTASATTERTQFLGLKWPKPKWTDTDDLKLRQCVEDSQTQEQMLGVLTDKTMVQIRRRMYKLGLGKSKRLTGSEMKIVSKGILDGLYYDQIAALLPGRSTSSIINIVRRHQSTDQEFDSRRLQNNENSYARRTIRHPHFSDEEVNLLKSCSAKRMTFNEIAELFPKRSWEGVRAKMRKLGLPFAPVTPSRKLNWSPLEDQLLAEHKQEGLDVLQQYLDRTPTAITKRLRQMREEQRAKHDTEWTDEDTQKSQKWLREGVKIRDIAKRLEKGYGLVWNRLNNLGLCSSKSKMSD